MTIGERHVRTGVTLAARNDGHRALAVAVPDPKQQGGRIGITRPQVPELIGANLRCGRLGWLDEHPASAAGCLVLVRAQPAPSCSHTHFVYADLGDRNCGCAPPRPADCEGPGSKDVIGAVVVSLYRAGGVDSEGAEKPPYHTSPAPVDVATEGLIPRRGSCHVGTHRWANGTIGTRHAYRLGCDDCRCIANTPAADADAARGPTTATNPAAGQDHRAVYILYVVYELDLIRALVAALRLVELGSQHQCVVMTHAGTECAAAIGKYNTTALRSRLNVHFDVLPDGISENFLKPPAFIRISRWSKAWPKVAMPTLHRTGYSKLVLLDVDMFLEENLDELFQLSINGATPWIQCKGYARYIGVNSGLLYLLPSAATELKMLASIDAIVAQTKSHNASSSVVDGTKMRIGDQEFYQQMLFPAGDSPEAGASSPPPVLLSPQYNLPSSDCGDQKQWSPKNWHLYHHKPWRAKHQIAFPLCAQTLVARWKTAFTAVVAILQQLGVDLADVEPKFFCLDSSSC